MSAHDDPRSLGATRLSFADSREVEEFVATLARFEAGEIGPDEWRAYRLVRGVYGQRQDAVQMVRVKIPQGILDAAQLRALGAVARQYSRGFGHLTTRQNLQFHFVAPTDIEAALRTLAEAGLTTREACGNSVRNITACAYAGVGADEVFDVTPYAEALTRFLLRHPLASTLPRKFKIAWEGCAEDHVQLGIHDLGFRALTRATTQGFERGFRVTVGGGTATLCRSGTELVDFLPVAEILGLALSVLRVFHALGDYAHKQRNRLKYLIQTLGWERFRGEVLTAWAAVRAEGAPALPFDAQSPPVEGAPAEARLAPPTVDDLNARVAAETLRGPGILPAPPALALSSVNGHFAHWNATNVTRQKQEGFVAATVTVPLGDLTAAQLEILAELTLAYADGTLRTTSEQNLVLRWVRATEAPALFARLAAAGLGAPDAERLADIVTCPGAESCRLAVTQSRGLGRLLGDFLGARPDLRAAASELRLRVSGCPNGCGRHHVADIGFQGGVRQVDGRAAPLYFVLIGGGLDGDATRFGRVAAKIPARRVPEAVERLIALYLDRRRDGETAREFLRRVDLAEARQALADLTALDAGSARPEDFIDLGDDSAFEVTKLEGECSA
jgi:sulfite reductase beta subunit-like hemoprotein